MKFFDFLSRKMVLGSLFVGFAAIIPFLFTVWMNGGWVDIFPIYGDIDHNYYYARIREVLDGNLLLGNPFYIEHTDNFALAFSIAEWVAAIPILLTNSFVVGQCINTIFWAIVFFALLYGIFREFGVTEKKSLFVGAIIFIANHSLLTRPIAMQMAFPFFLAFCFAHIQWIKDPSRRKFIYLIFTGAINFYIYSYSWQIIGATLITSVCYFFYIEEREKAIHALKAGFLTLILSLPVLIYTAYQSFQPLYWEAALRTAMVITRIPTSGIVIYGGPLVVAVLFFFYLKNYIDEKQRKIMTSFIACIVPSLFIAAMSNVITAKDPELVSHVGRYMVLVSLIIGCAMFSSIKFIVGQKKQKTVFLFFSILTMFLGNELWKNIRAMTLNVSNSVADQSYHKPLFWLEHNSDSPSVVLANPSITGFIPIVTRHYVLFSVFGGNHILSNAEQVERYLVSQFDTSKIDEKYLENDLRIFTGTGPAIHQPNAINRRVRFCYFFRIDSFGYSCGAHISVFEYLGSDYLSSIKAVALEVHKNKAAYYDKFHVRYLILDRNNDVKFASLSLFSKKIYDDGRFEIWER